MQVIVAFVPQTLLHRTCLERAHTPFDMAGRRRRWLGEDPGMD